MVSLARSMLRFEWRRFLPALLAVAFAGLLILVQLGLLLGLFGTISVYVDRSGADLWAGFPNTQSIDLARDIPAHYEVLLRMHPAVTRVEHFNWSTGDWRPPGGKAVSVFLIGVDPSPEALAFSKLLAPELRARLDEPDTVLIDEADAEKLGVRVGQTAEVNGKTVRVAGTVRGVRAPGGANVVTSRHTARRLDSSLRDAESSAWMLIKLQHPESSEAVRDALRPPGSLKPFGVWTSTELSRKSQMYWLLESGVGVGFLFSSLLGLLVGVVITSQTLVAAIVSSIREYAALRALGVSLGSLRSVVLEQSAWVGALGIVVTLGVAAALAWAARHLYVALELSPWATASTALTLVLVALASGLFALRALTRAEPAALLR